MISGQELKTFAIFHGLGDKLLDLLAGCAVRKSLGADVAVFVKGEKPHGFALIVTGQIKVYCESMGGSHQVLGFFEPGDSFAEAALFLNGYPATARTMMKSEIIWIPKLGFQSLLVENPELTLNLVMTLASRQRKLVGMVEDLTLRDARGRLCHYLSRLLSEEKGDNGIQIPVSQAALAQLLGVTEETLSRTIKSLRKDGIISSASKGHFGIENVKALERAYTI
jgi:CRP/FNR family transcriptional regulator, dissimilatory nitrate respiration regulator